MKTLVNWLNEGYEIFKKRMAAGGVDIEGQSPYQNSTPVVCEDGFTISTQASGSHYSTPRRYFDRLERKAKQYYNGPAAFHTVPAQETVIVDYGIYTAFELGYPSKVEPLIAEYAENPRDLTDTVYAYVPLETVETMIEKHGGIVGFVNTLE